MVIIGGSGAAISLTLYIIDMMEKTGMKDGNITLIDPAQRFGWDVNPSYIWRYRLRLKQAKVKELTYGTVKEITDTGIVADWSVSNRETKEKQEFRNQNIPADTVILAKLIPNQELRYGSAKKTDKSMIGDCVWVRRGIDAIQDGYRLGMRF